jgi:hypothetical protein
MSFLQERSCKDEYDVQEYEFAQTLDLDPRLVGRFIGKRGQNIQRLTVETGVAIQVDQRTKMAPKIILKGSTSGVAQAKEQVLRELKNLAEYENRAPRGMWPFLCLRVLIFLVVSVSSLAQAKILAGVGQFSQPPPPLLGKF